LPAAIHIDTTDNNNLEFDSVTYSMFGNYNVELAISFAGCTYTAPTASLTFTLDVACE